MHVTYSLQRRPDMPPSNTIRNRFQSGKRSTAKPTARLAASGGTGSAMYRPPHYLAQIILGTGRTGSWNRLVPGPKRRAHMLAAPGRIDSHRMQDCRQPADRSVKRCTRRSLRQMRAELAHCACRGRRKWFVEDLLRTVLGKVARRRDRTEKGIEAQGFEGKASR